MSRTKLAVLGIIIIVVGLTAAQTLFTVRETEQAIVLQFGFLTHDQNEMLL